jgi:alkanesulfonate monooxygenase SsuD/methylene tetrahydromethanopterin reductase-like flavin-dependent oxidoreductase (luciferase family)
MDIGLMIDSDYNSGQTQQEALAAVLTTAQQAEARGFDGVWLAERHFSPPGGASLVPSVGAAPLLLATAIAMRTRLLRIGTAVLLLPLGHPVRLAEEVATLDHLCQGRLELGIGRSSFPRAYEGYAVPYEESRARFQEYLEIMRLAWTQTQLSYDGKFYTCKDLAVLPQPYQHPHPPLHQAASTHETFVASGSAGLALLVALIGNQLSDLAGMVAAFRTAWQDAGHPGQGAVRLRLPIYVAATQEQAEADPYTRVMPYYERLRQGYLRSATHSFEKAERSARATQLATLTYAQVLQERVVFGTPDYVVHRLHAIQQAVGLAGIIVEPNVGGSLPPALVERSMDLFFREVVPHLRPAT